MSDTEASLLDGSRAAAATSGLSPVAAKIGLMGSASVMERLSSMRTTSAIRGRSCGSSWTQSSPMWMHISISCCAGSSAGQLFSSGGKFPWPQCPQTCSYNHACITAVTPFVAGRLLVEIYLYALIRRMKLTNLISSSEGRRPVMTSRTRTP
jgi:hypothetical protein